MFSSGWRVSTRNVAGMSKPNRTTNVPWPFARKHWARNTPTRSPSWRAIRTCYKRYTERPRLQHQKAWDEQRQGEATYETREEIHHQWVVAQISRIKNAAACAASTVRLASRVQPCRLGSKKSSSASAFVDHSPRPGSRRSHVHDPGTECIAVPASMIPLALILLRRRSDVPGTRTNHLICLILLNAMADPADGSS
jgi:hypothetical protein